MVSHFRSQVVTARVEESSWVRHSAIAHYTSTAEAAVGRVSGQISLIICMGKRVCASLAVTTTLE